MSDYGVFEATSTDGHEEEQRQRQARRDLGTAIEAAREGFGDFLGSSTDKQDYQDRLALVMNDLMQKVADSGVMPVPGVMRKVKAALRPEFRTSVHEKTALKWYVTPSTDPKLGDDWSTWDPTKGSYPTEPWASVAYTEYGASPSWSWGVHRPSDETDIIFAVGYEADRETAFDKATSALRELRTQYAASRKRAWFNPDITDDNLLGALQIAEVLLNAAPDDQERIDKVDELRAEVEARGLTPLKTSRSRKTASRSLREIAAEIRADWKNVYFGAEPYLDAMSSLDSINDSYGQDSASSIVAYFLSNATSWRGETARRVKKELKELSKRRAHKTADQWDDEINRSIDEYLDATSTPRIAPHPEYGEGVWSDEGVKQRVLSLNPNLPVPELVDAIMREMGDLYDSIDRELAFWYFSQVTGKDYDDFYNAWLAMPSGKYFSRRKTALKWKDTDFNSWVKMDGGAWSLEVEEVGGDFWVYFNGGPADGQMEQLSASSMEEAKAEAESIASSKGITASRKQAGSAQVLQKLENALNDQRSVDVICSNSPDGSFSGEREIPVDEGLQKVRGWISAGDLVDTAQDGGNFFDFEHRASGENVNFYITQEY